MGAPLEVHNFDSSPIFHDAGYQHSAGEGAGPAVHGHPPVKSEHGIYQTPEGERLSGGDAHEMGRSSIYEAEHNGPAAGHENASVHQYDYTPDAPASHSHPSNLALSENSAAEMARQTGDETDAARAVNETDYAYAHSPSQPDRTRSIAAGRVKDTDAVIAKSRGDAPDTEYASSTSGDLSPDYASMAKVGKSVPAGAGKTRPR